METAAPWPIGIQLLGKAEAAAAFAACEALDPEGIESPQSAAAAGDCYKLTTPAGSLVYSASPRGYAFWVHAAFGQGRGMTERGLAAIEYQARKFGCEAVAFQTLRRGLIRKASRLGYTALRRVGAGFVLQKALHG